MADLGELDRAGAVKIAGAPASGIEDNYLEVDVNGYIGSIIYTASRSAINFGQSTMANSIPVTIASDQSAIPASQSGTWTVQPGNTANTTPWLVTDSSDGPVTPGTAAGKASLIAGQFNTALPTLTTGQQSAIQLDSSGRQLIAPLTNASAVKAQLQDNAGNGINSNNSQLQVRDVINTAGQNRAQSVSTTAAEALGAATILANRKFISITPTNGTVYWGFTNGVTTASGTPIFKNTPAVFSFTDNVHIYLICASGTVDCRIAEGS